MKRYPRFLLLILTVIVALVVAGCSSTDTAKKSKKVDTKFPLTTKVEGEADPDAVLNVALVSDTPFQGILNPNFYSGAPDSNVLSFFYPSLFSIDEDFNITNDGGASVDYSDDHRTITVKLHDDLNWSTGEPVTADDYLFSFEVIGNKDYDGVRYDEIFENIEGMTAYHEGKADKISGLRVVDEKTAEIKYTQANPAVKTGLWSYAMQRSAYKDIPVSKMSASDPVRKTPVGYGQYKIDSMVTGESVKFSPNEHYFGKKAQVAGVTLSVASPDTINEGLKQGKIDIALGYPSTQYDPKHEIDTVTFLGKEDLAYSYLGFKLGKFDQKKGENVMDPKAKMADVKLRQAMAYAMNNAEVGEKIYLGLRWPANSMIIPSFKSFHDANIKGYPYDPKKANQILDEAGYEQKEGEAYRRTPDGKELVIQMAAMTGDKQSEPLNDFYIQNWKDIGIEVKLTDGRPMEFNSFYDRVQKDDKAIDIYMGAWSTGTDMNPSELYGRKASFNYPRYTSEANDRLMADGQSEAAFDHDYRKKVYDEWQQLMMDDVPVAPTLYRYSVSPVNKRVNGYTIETTAYNRYEDVQIIKDK